MDDIEIEKPLTEQEIMEQGNLFQENLVKNTKRKNRSRFLLEQSVNRQERLVELSQNIQEFGKGALISRVIQKAGEFIKDYELTGHTQGLQTFFDNTDDPILRPELDQIIPAGITVKQFIMGSLNG